MKVRNLLVALMGLCLGLGACASPAKTVQLTEKDAAQTVKLRVNDRVVVRLPVQMGTGYSWQLTDNPFFRLVSQRLDPPAESRPGAGSRQEFQLEALKPGTTRLALRLVRPWEANELPQKTFEVNVQIEN